MADGEVEKPSQISNAVVAKVFEMKDVNLVWANCSRIFGVFDRLSCHLRRERGKGRIQLISCLHLLDSSP